MTHLSVEQLSAEQLSAAVQADSSHSLDQQPTDV